MSKYVMSDLHGCYDKFIKMLDKIELKDSDELYILGDVMDRKGNPLDILDYILSHENITLLKGSHEQMYIEFYENDDISLCPYTAGQITDNRAFGRDSSYEEGLYRYLKALPFIKVVDKFILVHAGLHFSDESDNLSIEDFIKSQKEEDCLWDRSNIRNECQYRDYTVICGHTPVQGITRNYDDASILRRPGTVYIDCGCYFDDPEGKLGCLRLDDMTEFYVSH